MRVTDQQVKAVADILSAPLNTPAHPDNWSRTRIQPRGIILHHMAGSIAGTDSWFRSGRVQRQAELDKRWNERGQKGPRPVAFVSSAHIGLGGAATINNLVRISTYVNLTSTSFHAGGALLPHVTVNPNTRMLGIEHETNPRHENTQIDTSAIVCALLAEVFKFTINESTVLGHNQVARTECPARLNVAVIRSRAIEIANSMKTDARMREILANFKFAIDS